MLPPSAREFKDIYVVFELMETDLHQVSNSCVPCLQSSLYVCISPSEPLHQLLSPPHHVEPSQPLCPGCCDLCSGCR